MLQTPQTEEQWRSVAAEYQKLWQFPHCIGALDGKHIAIKAPAGQGSTFYNYKHFHSIILLALVDANLKFLYVDVGANGRAGDAGVFRESSLFRGLEDKSLGIPGADFLPGTGVMSPYVIVGDDAFPLKPYLMKPYPERGDVGPEEKLRRRILNYRLSRARRCSENAFGLVTQRFGVLGSAMQVSPEKATIITQAVLCLHNFLVEERDRSYNNLTQGSNPMEQDQQVLQPLQGGGNRNTDDARAVRDNFKDYFNGPGTVPWQNSYA